MCLESSFQMAADWPKIMSQFGDMTPSPSLFDFDVFLLSGLVKTGQSFMSISSLVLELQQFSFIKD